MTDPLLVPDDVVDDFMGKLYAPGQLTAEHEPIARLVVRGLIAQCLDRLFTGTARVPCGDVRWGAENIREVDLAQVLAVRLQPDP